jgi:sialic acid synthase SpsE
MIKNTYIIAEIGNTHEGSPGLAKCFIKAAAECGVDAVKFQTHIFDAESLPDAPNPPYFKDETRKEYFERTAFPLEQWKKLKNYAEECGVDFLSSVFSLEAVDLLEEVGVKAYKVPSGEVTNLPLLIKLAKTGKKIYLSSGMSSWEELDDAVLTLQKNGARDIIIFQCTSEYPCPPEDAGLNVILELKKRYKLPVGYSDHTEGLAVPLAAVVLGAEVIEKHFTLSKKMYGSDAALATEPDEFERLVKEIRNLEIALISQVNKSKKANELKEMKAIFEKSIVTTTSLKAGTILEENHLAYKKPGDGIPARLFKDVIGKIIKRDLPANYKLKWEDLSDDQT